MSRRLLALTAVVIFVSSVHATDTGEETGAEILKPFKRDLKQALVTGLADGPEAAIEACKVQAPAIAEALSKDGVRVGRTSHRLRNPANAGPDWVMPLLDAYTSDAEDRAPRSVSLEDGRIGYVEPIEVKGLCLTCHGENLAPGIAERIEALYPRDKAVGYREGDLRGVFWAEFPSAE